MTFAPNAVNKPNFANPNLNPKTQLSAGATINSAGSAGTVLKGRLSYGVANFPKVTLSNGSFTIKGTLRSSYE